MQHVSRNHVMCLIIHMLSQHNASPAVNVLILNVSGQIDLSRVRLNVLLLDVLGQTYYFRIRSNQLISPVIMFVWTVRPERRLLK